MLLNAKQTTIFLILCMLLTPAFAQVDTLYYLNADFETIDERALWSSVPDTTYGWYNTNGTDPGPPPTPLVPPVPASGDQFMHFKYAAPEGTITSSLVSPPIDLSLAAKPRLAFQYAQPADFEDNRIAVLFQAGSGADWDTIRKFTANVDFWEQATFNIDQEGQKYLCNNFRVAFLAINNEVNGVSVDSVVVEEQDTIPKFVKSYQYTAVQHEVFSSQAEQVPIIKLRVEISGNEGVSVLSNLAFRLNDGEAGFFKASGFRIFHTVDDDFKNRVADTSTQVGSSVSMVGNDVVFSGLNQELKLGYNYIWLTADFANSIDHNSYFNFGVAANSLQVNDTIIPPSDINNIAEGYIEEAVFYDNFSTLKGWTLESDFEIGVPQGFEGTKTKDPDFAYSGTSVLGTDLSTDGYYEPNITPATGYYAYSPTFNLKYYDQIKVYMRKWNDIFSSDSATMAVSNDGGLSWHTIWISFIDDNTNIMSWREQLFEEEVNSLMARKEEVQFRFGINKTGASPRFGFNIDQFTLVANHLDTDVGITEIISPYNDCIGFNNDTVKIVVKNFAEGNSPARIPVYYALWGRDSLIVRDTIESAIPQDGSIEFKFSQLANFPRGDIYSNFTAGIELPGDEDPTNDSLVKVLYIQDTYTPPVISDFEYAGGVWIPDSSVVWQCKLPGSIPEWDGNSWLLYPNGNYANSDIRTITSGCYDLTGENNYILQFQYDLLSEVGKDGFAIEYTTNDGGNWNLIETSQYGSGWGWYTDSVDALGHIGWSGLSDGWTSAKELLPGSLSTENKVKFRFIWKTDEANVARGLAFDDFELFPAPPDVGVSTIAKPDSACQFINTDTVHVYVKNFGYNSLKANDTIIVGVDFEMDSPVIDTFRLASPLNVGDSVLVKIPTNIIIDNPGEYSISAYTLIEDDPHFYGSNNDTLTRTFTIWENPVSGMVDSLFSRQPDTLLIEPNFNANWDYLWYDNSTAPTHGVSQSDIFYSVTITERDHSCETKDSTYVQLLFNDVGIGRIVSPINSCELTTAESISVTVQNKGTDSLLVDEKIYVHYTINGGSVVKDSVILASSLLKGESITHTFNETYDFSAETDYVLTAYTEYGGDTVRVNDTVVNTISVFGYTPISLGPDYTVTALTDTLDAGPVFASYLWNTGDTTQTTVVDTSGKFWVDVLDVNGCSGVDTVEVYLKIRDIEAEVLLSPLSSCDRTGPENIQFQIRNRGTDTITTGNPVYVNYRLDGGVVVEETVTLPSDLLPNTSFVHEFASTEDVSGYTNYTFELTARTAGDLRVSNDSLTVVIQTSETPAVDLGGDRTINGYQYVLDAGAGADYTYLWNDNSTNQTLNTTVSGTYWVTVTNSLTGCNASDTATLTFDITDFAIQSFNIENNPCAIDLNGVEVSVLNNGNTVRNNATIKVGFYVGNQDPVVEEHTVSGAWAPLAQAVITLENPVSLKSQLGSTNITVYLDQAGDLEPGNDALTRNVNVIEAPIVPIDGDTIRTSLPYTIDATTPGDNFYQWGDNTTGATYTADVYGKYTVAVTNSSGCTSIANVWLDRTSYVNQAAIDNLDIKLYPNPVSDVLTIDAELKTGDEFIVEMFDISNRVVFSEVHEGYSKYENRIDVSSMSNGVYFLRIRNKEIYYVKRIIVK